MLRRTPLKCKTGFKSKPKVKNEGNEKPKRKNKEPNYVADMDKIFQYWVRLRDSMPGGYCRCISCGQIKSFDQIQAGHYMSRKHMSVRWSPLNCNGECVFDNAYNGDHLIGYRKNLIKKIGEEKVEWLEAESKRTKKWSNFEIKLLVKYYSKEILQLSAAKHIPITKGVLDIIKRYEKKKL